MTQQGLLDFAKKNGVLFGALFFSCSGFLTAFEVSAKANINIDKGMMSAVHHSVFTDIGRYLIKHLISTAPKPAPKQGITLRAPPPPSEDSSCSC